MGRSHSSEIEPFSPFLSLFLQGITPVKSVSYNTHDPILTNKETSITDPNGPSFAHPQDNQVIKIAISEGAGELTKRLFDEREQFLRNSEVRLLRRRLILFLHPLTVTSQQCGDRNDDFGWLWPSEGIDASDAA